jgi:hypothetical protein
MLGQRGVIPTKAARLLTCRKISGTAAMSRNTRRVDVARSWAAALYALAINFAVSAVLSLLLNPIGATRGADQTTVTDYHL